MRRRFLVALAVLAAGQAAAVQVTTMPLQLYGLGELRCAAYSPDGNYILTGGGAGAFLWDAATGEVIRMFLGHSEAVRSVAFSPDGTKVLTGSYDDTAIPITRRWTSMLVSQSTVRICGRATCSISGNTNAPPTRRCSGCPTRTSAP